MNIYQKLIEVRKVVPYLQKENSGGQYKYVSSSQVLANCKAKMDELGLLLIPQVASHKLSESAIELFDKDHNVTKRTITYFTELDVIMTWVNAEKPDETISCPWYGQGVDIAGEKGVGKALTYAEKYFMLKFFNIPTDKDDPDAFQKKLEDDQEPEPNKNKPQQQNKPKNDSSPAQNGWKMSEIQKAEMLKAAKDKNVDMKVKGKEWTKKESSWLWDEADYSKVMEELKK